MKNRYYINPDTEELVIVTETADGDHSIVELSMIGVIEYEDEEDVEEEEEKPKRQYKKRSDSVPEKKTDESWRSGRRVTLKQRTWVRVLLKKGKNSKEISDEIGEDLEFTNQIIEKVKGADMDFKVEEKEGVGL